MSRFTPTLDQPILQELAYADSGDPWRVVVACVLLNKTARGQVDLVWPVLMNRWPDAGSLAYRSDDAELEHVLRPLGLQYQRARRLQSMSHEWCSRPEAWTRGRVAFEYPGLGEYAQDAHDLVVRGMLLPLPEDRALREWARLLLALPESDRPRAGP